MTWADIETNWDVFAPQVQDRWGRLSEDDLKLARRGRDDLLSCVMRRYRIDPEIAARHVDDWINSASELPEIARLMHVGAVESERASA